VKILIVDDEVLIRELIAEYVINEGYTCDLAEDGSKAIELCLVNDYDLIIMDIMMPNIDGLSALKYIKAKKDIPAILLSARKEELDKLQGFEVGADDYVTKPFSPKELMARIKAITKRNKKSDVISVGNISINENSHDVIIDGEIVDMTNTQYELLKLFLENEGMALSRDKIIERIWGYEYEADDRTIDAHIKLLRSKLGKYRNSIKTIRKVGYRFNYEEE
jgi:DNA-binding response OmpR family regulator